MSENIQLAVTAGPKLNLQTDFEIIHKQIVQMGGIHLLIKRVIEKSSFVVIKSEACFANPRLSEFPGVKYRRASTPTGSEMTRNTCSTGFP